MGLRALTVRPGSSPETRDGLLDGPRLVAVQVESSQAVPTQRSFEQLAVGRVVVMHHAAEEAHLHPLGDHLRHRGDKIDAVSVDPLHGWKVEARLDVAAALLATLGEHVARGLLIAVDAGVVGHDPVVEHRLKLIEAAVPIARIPERRGFRELARVALTQLFERHAAFQVQVRFGLRQRSDEVGQIGGGLVVSVHGVSLVSSG